MAKSNSKSKSKSRSVGPSAMDVDAMADAKEEEAKAEGQEEQDGDDDEEQEEEGEFEVEAILDHTMKSGKYTYLVSWKGYGPEHNTWEPAAHVAHAEDVVSHYWDNKPKTAIKQASKRGRPSGSTPSQPARKATRTSKGSGGQGKRNPKLEEDELEEEPGFEVSHVDSTEKYADLRSWEDLVVGIDTIERGPENKLVVYLTMTGGEKFGVPTEVAYLRCPQRILKFYEAHLKWRLPG